MRVLAISVAPVYPNRVMGGSQRVLMEAIDSLAAAGYEVRLLSPDVPESESFETPSGARIEPALKLRGGFPAPFQTSPDRLASTWRLVAKTAIWADRAYLHADAFYFREALDGLPVVRSLHDFVYEEALVSAFSLPAERTIVPSNYMRSCVEATAGAVVSTGEIVVIPNGVAAPNWPVEPQLPQGIRDRQPGDLILLHPHRLHVEKGIEESTKIAVDVQRRMPDRRVRLLAPGLASESSRDEADLGMDSIHESARKLGGEDLLELHAWLDLAAMPAYFAAGDITLCPGRFVESFGLVPLESVAAGTPAVCARVGGFREHEGLPGLRHFDFGDTQTAASIIVELAAGEFDEAAAARDVASQFDMETMRQAYVDAICGPLASTEHTAAPAGQSLRIAPWCHVSGERIYHDYLGRFARFPEITAAANESGSLEDVGNSPGLMQELKRARSDGFVI